MLALVGSEGKNARIHANGITGACFHTEAAEDTAQFIDGEGERVFFDRGVGMLPSDDMDAQRRAGGGTKHAGGTAWGAVFFAHESMPATIAFGHVRRLFRILLRDR